MNLPTKLTVLRMIMIPAFIAVFYIEAIPYNSLFACLIFVMAALTDFLDGYIARKYNMVTDLGKFLDPIADKVLVSSALVVMLTVPDYLPTIVGGVAVSLILAREFIVSAFRIIAAGKGLVLAADKFGKFKTIFQDVAIIVLLIGKAFGALYSPINIVGLVLLALATVLSVGSGANYIIRNREVLK